MSEFSVKHDTTPATHGDLDIWAGRLIEIMEENKEEIKQELRAEIKESSESVKQELRTEIGEVKDNQLEMMLMLKALVKKNPKK